MKKKKSHHHLLILSPLSCLALHSNCCLQEARGWTQKLTFHSRFLFYFKNTFSIIYLSAKQVFKVFLIVCLYMCGCFVFDQNFVLGFTKPYRIKSFFCHPMERISFLERTYVRCICYKRLRQTMPSSQTGGNRVGLTGETQVVSLC